MSWTHRRLHAGKSYPATVVFQQPRLQHSKLLEDQEPEAWIHGWTTLTKNWSRFTFCCLNCTKFGQLILQKIIKIVASRCQILRLKCTKFDFVWGSAPDFAGVAYSAPPDLLAGFNGPTSKVRGKGGEGRERRGKEGQKEGTGRGRVRVHTGTSFFPLPALQLGLSQYYYTVSDCHLRISIDRSP